MSELGKILTGALALANRPRSLRDALDVLAAKEREEYRRNAQGYAAGLAAPAAPKPVAARPIASSTANDARMDREAAALKAQAAARLAGKMPAGTIRGQVPTPASRSIVAFAPSSRQPERPRQPEPNRRAPPIAPEIMAMVNKVLADRNARLPQALSSGNFTMARRPGR